MIYLNNDLYFDPILQAYIKNEKKYFWNQSNKKVNNSIVSTKEIKSVVLFITNACNLSCPYCYEWKKKKTLMDMKYVEKIIKLYGDTLSGFAFFGGEPFLEFDFIKKLYLYINEKLPNVKFSINTNGTLITDEMFYWLKENNISLVFSWDGYDDNKRYNGDKNVSDKVLNNIIKAKQFDIKCSSRFTVTNIDYHSLVQSVDKLIENDIKYVIEPAVDVENNTIMDSAVDTITQFYELSGKYIRFLPDYNNIYNQLKNGFFRYYGCGAGKRVIRMDTNGDIYDCHRQIPRKSSLISNVMNLQNKNDLDNNRFFDCKVTNRNECVDCDYKFICGGGCNHSFSDKYCLINKSKINSILRQLFYDYFS